VGVEGLIGSDNGVSCGGDAARSRSAFFAALDDARESMGTDAANFMDARLPARLQTFKAMLCSSTSLARGELREVRIKHSNHALALATKRCVRT
jgi:hypothetical protein